MSQIKLKHSGGNSVIIAAPDSNPASDRTLKLPSNADGTVLTTTNPKAGNIIQVVSTTKTDTFTTTSTSAVAITGLSVSITPSSSSNKIFLIASIGAASTTNNDFSTFFYFYRGGSLITGTVGDTESSCTSAAFSLRSSLAARHESTTGHFLDSPSSTSALTYQLYCSIESGGGTSVINRDGHSSQTSASRPRNISSITAMEVAA